MIGGLFLRAAFAFLALPGLVAFVIPLFVFLRPGGWTDAWLPGLVVTALGCVVLAWCVRDFYVAGRGTLAPWSPPKTLVRVGLYQYSRNPMYVGVLTIVAGWAFAFRSTALGWYGATLLVAFQLRVVYGEEPWLAESFGDEWAQYRARVSRWLPVLSGNRKN